MKRLVVGLLLAATALAPVVAHAQAQRLERPEDFTEGLSPEPSARPTREQRQERRAERAERRAERGEAPADRPRRVDRPERRPDADGARPARPDRPLRRLDGDGERQARPDRMAPRREGQIFPPVRQPRPELREQRREAREDRREIRRDRVEDRRSDRRRGAADWNNGFGDRGIWRGDAVRDRDDRADWGRDAYRGGQVWNRSWRSDRRYDWNGYRQGNGALYRLPRYYAPQGHGYQYRRYGLGSTLSRSLFGPDYWLDDPYGYRLPPAYGPYRWVRYFDDALLVDLRTGRVVDLVYGIFY